MITMLAIPKEDQQPEDDTVILARNDDGNPLVYLDGTGYEISSDDDGFG